jgi:hypothetical protein
VNFITNGWNRIDRLGANGSFGGPAGNFAAMSTSWYSPAGTSDDWLISPSVAISGTAPALIWKAKAQDPDFPDGYKVMLSPTGGNTIADFTVQLFSIGAENSSWKERNVNLSAYIGQNIRFAFVNNSTDQFMLLVDDIKVLDDFTPSPYCDAEGDAFFEAIGRVTVTNSKGEVFDNDNDPDFYDSADGYQDFTNLGPINLVAGSTGNAIKVTKVWWDFDDDEAIAVWIDFNGNGIFEPSERVFATSPNNITPVSGTFSVPSSVTVGSTTRMRVMLNWDVEGTAMNPCSTTEFGQVEDYTVKFVDNLAATQETNMKNSVKIYPNPVSDILNIESTSKVLSISVYDLTGKMVAYHGSNEEKSQINVSKLAAGAYIVKIQTEKGDESTKIIKK